MSVTSLVRTEMAIAIAVALAIGLLLLALRPHDRPRVRNTLIVLGLCAVAELFDGFMTSMGGAREVSAMVADAASVLIGLVVVRLATFFVFRVTLPALHLELPRIAEDLSTAGLYLGWIVLWLRLSGMNPTSLFTTSAIVTAVVAFAMQDTLGNVLGGVLLQTDQSIRVGDWVRIDDITGQVVQIRWRYTAVENRNGETIVIPNGWLIKNRFTVLASRRDPEAPWRRWVRVSVDLSASPTDVCAVLVEAVRNARIPNVAAEPGPSAVLMDMAAHQGHYALRYWMHDRKPDDPTDSAVRAHILAALARHGMKLGATYYEQLAVKDNQAHRDAELAADTERRVEALAHVELFSALTDAERASLARHLVYAPFAAGDVITKQGAVAHWLYLIISGRAEVWRETPAKRVLVATLEGGDLFGEMGMMTGAPRGATVTAVTDVVCYRLDKDGFATILSARPDIASSMSKVLAKRQEELEERVRESLPGTEHAPAHHEAILDRIRVFFGLEQPADEKG